MSTHSAGIALVRFRDDGAPEVLLGRFGGPYWRNRERAWGIPKGEFDPAKEDPEAAARREFTEETGFEAPEELARLGTFPVGSGKETVAFWGEGDVDPERLQSDEFELEWPPDSGRRQRFAEIERGAWFALPEARERVVKSQVALIEALGDALAGSR